MGFYDENDKKNEVLGISINASGDSSYYPQDSISIIDINKPGAKPKTLLGLFTNQVLSGVNPYLASDLHGKYGLYSDNAYIKGTMVSETEGEYLAGITTTDKIEVMPWGKEQPEHIVFFAGTNLKETITAEDKCLKFYVTKEGTMYASDGYFEGTIRTSKIIGSGTDYALTITGETTNALRFTNYQEEVDNKSNDKIDFLSFTTNGSYFYRKENSSEQLFGLLHSDYAIGMFGGIESKIVDGEEIRLSQENVDFYRLSFTRHTKDSQEWIQMNCGNNMVAKITSEGFKAVGNNDLGDNCNCVTVKKDSAAAGQPKQEKIIGVNFVLKGISQ